MQDFTKRRGKGNQIRRFFLGIAMLLVLGLITFGAAHAAWGMYGKFAEAATDNDAAQQNLAGLQTQDASVQAEVTALNSPEGQEAQLRQSYGVALPGEGEIQIVREAPTSTAPAAASQDNFVIKILKALFVW
jgi:cell division protein FtsB